MIKHCFAYFNKLGDFYGTPFFVDQKEEFVKALRQMLFAAKKEELESLKEDELFYIGGFDNETGEMLVKKEFMCSMSGTVEEILNKKFGGDEHGRA